MSRRSRIARLAVLGLACALILESAARGDEVRGTVQLLAKGGKGPAKESEVRQAVVYYEPAGGAAPRRPRGPVAVSRRQQQFLPRRLGGPRGARGRFPTRGPVLQQGVSGAA